MIIYGSRLKSLLSFRIHFQCHHCGHDEQVAHVLQGYFHLFWIPTFPLRKQLAVECPHCRALQRQNEFSKQTLNEFAPLKSEAKTPLWMFTGAVLFAMLMGLSSVP